MVPYQKKSRVSLSAFASFSRKAKTLLVKSRNSLDSFNKKIAEAQEKRGKDNLAVDEQTFASLKETPQNKWERVVKYIDFNRSDLHEKDVSKMKSLLLQLKH